MSWLYSSTLWQVLISKVCSRHVSKVMKNKLLTETFPYLCCNACMVAARDPQHFAALHSSPNGFKHFKHYISKRKFFFACFWSHIIWQLWLLWVITIEPERLLWLRWEHGPGEACRSRWEEEYTWRRSDLQHEVRPPAQQDDIIKPMVAVVILGTV